MNSANFLQVLPGGHCLICHKNWLKGERCPTCRGFDMKTIQEKVTECGPECDELLKNIGKENGN